MSVVPAWVIPLLITFTFSVSACASITDLEPANILTEQRKLFLRTDRDISAGRITRARKAIQALSGYPLVPYLEKNILLRDLYRVKPEEVESFIDRNAGTWAGEKTRLRWLIVLNARRQFHDYIRHYQHIEPSTKSECMYLEALIATGDADRAHEEAPRIWLVGTSQPAECDPLFASWRTSAAFNEEYIWKRFLLARQARQYGLARYLAQLVKSAAIRDRIRLYHSVRGNPKLVLDNSRFDLQNHGQIEVFTFGLRQLAETDPQTAQRIFEDLVSAGAVGEGDGLFDPVQQQSLLEALMKSWTRKDQAQRALDLASRYPTLIREQQLDWQLQSSLRDLDWHAVLDWSAFLDAESAATDKWQYWTARASSALGQTAAEKFADLAGRRSFYSHLASLLIEEDLTLKDAFTLSDPESLARIKSNPAVQQAYELNAVGYSLNARNAWNIFLWHLSEEDAIVAGQAAYELNLPYSAIVSIAKAAQWDNLHVRFPLAFESALRKAAAENKVSLAWLYGIARQESSFAPDIRSPAGAVGLTQILPATARTMASKTGVRYERDRLREPEYNALLGGAYLRKGMATFGGNMIYATAAYNAGISRVRTWTRNSAGEWPLDVWIEVIPFRETRRYVKHVMTHSAVYALKLGLEAPLITMSPQLFVGARQNGAQ